MKHIVARGFGRRVALVAFLAAGMVFLTGCGKGSAEISGQVKYNGNLVETGTVTLLDAEGKLHQANIENGTYSIKGVAVGTGKLGVVSFSPQMAEGVKNISSQGQGRTKGSKPDTGDPPPPVEPPVQVDQSGWSNVPSKYNDVQKSGLTHEIRSGTNTRDLILE